VLAGEVSNANSATNPVPNVLLKFWGEEGISLLVKKGNLSAGLLEK